METKYNWINYQDVISVPSQRKDATDILQFLLVKSVYARKLRGEKEDTVLYSKSFNGYVDTDIIHEFLLNIAPNSLFMEESENHTNSSGNIEMCRTYCFPNDSIVQCSDHDGRVYLTLLTASKHFFDTCVEFLIGKFNEVPPQGNVMMLANEGGNFYLTSIGVISSPLVRYNYTKKDIETYDAILSDLKTDSPSGRLVLLEGEPGTGKSYFIKGLISEGDALFVFIPAALIGEISAPHLTPILLQQRNRPVPIVLIMEDADATLVTRQIDNVSKLSELLNISDGILGDLADVRVIATTNAKRPEIDPAVLREGRLSHYIKFEALTPKIANAAYENITGEKGPFTEKTALSTIYQVARHHGWLPTKNNTGLRPRRRVGAQGPPVLSRMGF